MHEPWANDEANFAPPHDFQYVAFIALGCSARQVFGSSTVSLLRRTIPLATLGWIIRIGPSPRANGERESMHPAFRDT